MQARSLGFVTLDPKGSVEFLEAWYKLPSSALLRGDVQEIQRKAEH